MSLLVDYSHELLLNLSYILADVLKFRSEANIAAEVLMLLVNLILSEGQWETMVMPAIMVIQSRVVQEMLSILLLYLSEVVEDLSNLLLISRDTLIEQEKGV